MSCWQDMCHVAVYYQDRFYPGTVINENSFGGKKVEEVKEMS